MIPTTRGSQLLNLLYLLMTLAPLGAGAACTGGTPGQLWDYEGTVGDDDHVRVTLEFHGARVFGRYFHLSQLDGSGPVEDVPLVGALIDGGKAIELDEVDAAGAAVGKLRGDFAESAPHDGKPALTCHAISGEWQEAGEAARPVSLKRTDTSPGTLAHRYGIVGAADDAPVNEGAWRFWNALRRDDRPAVAAQVAYPLEVQRIGDRALPNHEPLKVQTPEELLKNFDLIFWPMYKKLLSMTVPRNMMANDRAVFLSVRSDSPEGGSGAFAMFNAEGKVKALNN